MVLQMRLDNTNHGSQLFWASSIFSWTDGPCQESVFEKKKKAKHISVHTKKLSESTHTIGSISKNSLWPIHHDQ